ncbi:Uncharacterized protein SAMN05421770_103351 [Granulicella rosea]|uniref:Uncharacterized protein n=1 Tax=Granulicella rosea TaxID=474952 RepID=A0A239IYP0_9BACT|nr:hypothetical protein [Granulicella rosea]SNS98679.1 Uncharacterized protein SAMN05421770_103351 [Granulicella rosea]
MDRLTLRNLGLNVARAAAVLFALAIPGAAHAVSWFPFGPDGGDARSFAADPQDHQHIFLGTINGWIYESHDSGAKWIRLANVGKRDDLALDNILVDPLNPKHILVGAWVLDHPDGGLFVSNDGGHTWENLPQMRGQSIRSMTESHSDPKTMLAGTLEGVYRSVDSGRHWRQISPVGSKELHEVESVAIDTADPNTLYAGTWHLPWKSTDGGEHWANMKEGIIEDSDVFSIIVDPVTPQNVYLSACSGIYKSEDRGGRFVKVQGIPSSARRTRVLMQDPSHQATVFAGTTEGLFRSDDSGKNWIRTTGPEVIVNDVYIDEKDPRHVLLATDRGGVLASDDGGDSFRASNNGFSARQITTFAADAKHPATVYVGVVNDKDWGGVFQSTDGGLRWQQQSVGLQGRDVFSLVESHTGTLLAGTAHGIFVLKEGVWTRVDGMPVAKKAPAAKPAARKTAKGKAVTHRAPEPRVIPIPAAKSFDPSVNALAATDIGVIAATSAGLLTSDDDGASWATAKGTSAEPWRFVAASHRMVVAATLHGMEYSVDSGATWKPAKLPEKLTQVAAVAVETTGELWVGGREGVFVSADGGASWSVPENLFISGVNSIFYDGQNKRILLTALGATTMAFSVQMPERKVSFVDTGWNLRFVRPVGDHLVGATLFDGIVVQPKMVASPMNTAQTASR